MAAEGWGEEKFIPRGRSTVKNKERGGGRGVKSRGVGGEGGEERLKKKKKKKTVGVARVTCSKKTTSLVFHLKALIQRLKYGNK